MGSITSLIYSEVFWCCSLPKDLAFVSIDKRSNEHNLCMVKQECVSQWQQGWQNRDGNSKIAGNTHNDGLLCKLVTCDKHHPLCASQKYGPTITTKTSKRISCHSMIDTTASWLTGFASIFTQSSSPAKHRRRSHEALEERHSKLVGMLLKARSYAYLIGPFGDNASLEHRLPSVSATWMSSPNLSESNRCFKVTML